MGTRNLTMVVKDGKYKVAQYGQWDGYPRGQGVTVLNFLKNADLNKFRQQVDKVVIFDGKSKGSKQMQDRVDKLFDRLNEGLRNSKTYDSQEVAKKIFNADEKLLYDCFTRDTCAKILNVIYEARAEAIPHFSELSFAADSLFCEWAYLVNLDTDELEVYVGFNKEPLKKGDRFKGLRRPSHCNKEYYPIRLLKTYKFSELPSEKKFVKELSKLAGEEDDE